MFSSKITKLCMQGIKITAWIMITTALLALSLSVFFQAKGLSIVGIFFGCTLVLFLIFQVVTITANGIFLRRQNKKGT